MSNSWGNRLKLSIFGESHGEAIGMVVDGLPAGLTLDLEAIQTELDRRKPGQDPTATKRKEDDQARIVSGVLGHITTGAPICAIIQNTNMRSADYKNAKTVARPSHADFAAYVKYRGYNDVRGGGHFSGRMTAPLVFAGALAKQYLQTLGVFVGAHILSIGSVCEQKFDACAVNQRQLAELCKLQFPVLDNLNAQDDQIEQRMREQVERARNDQDSVGGVIECAAVGLPVGWGEPFFESVESKISSLLFSVPAVKGVEFGEGFNIAKQKGSQANDAFYYDRNHVLTKTNHNGGINGGITNGMPVIARAAIKPTPSIGIEQESVDYMAKENARIKVTGRHDPCIVLRAVPVIESAVSIALCECALLAMNTGSK